ncbi:MAG: pilus assembly protein TadG-related protein [Dehalococcoidia bacterium]
MKRRLSDSSGQAIVLSVLAATLFALFAALSIDVGLMLTDRRDAQSDVDKAALAGALQLTLQPGDAAADTTAATAAAQQWAQQNGIDTAEPGVSLDVQVINTCYSASDAVPTGVTVSLQRDPRTFLFGVLGISMWHVNTTATACAGRPYQVVGFLPFAMSASSACFEDDGLGNRVPVPGMLCPIYVDNSSTGLASQLNIDPDGPTCSDTGAGANDVYNNTVTGVQMICSIGDEVNAKAGFDIQKVRTGIVDRLAGMAPGSPVDGACESNFTNDGGTVANFNAGNAALNAVANIPLHTPSRSDGMDDFYEVWRYDSSASSPAVDLVPYDCNAATGAQTSPRSVQLITINNYAVNECGSKCYIVRGFSRAYIEGCTDGAGVFHKNCIWSGAGGAGGPFTLWVRFVEQLPQTNVNLSLQAANGDIGVFLKQ